MQSFQVYPFTLVHYVFKKNKEMDLRLGMTASMLDDIFNDPNLPLHFGPLCLQIQTALETLLAEARRK